MEVNIFGEGAVGYKNIVKSSSSQDFFLYKKYKNYAVCTVADGHSMDVFKYSHIGSYLACQSVFEILKTYKLNEDIELYTFTYKENIKKIRKNDYWIGHYKRNRKIKRLTKEVLNELIDVIFVRQDGTLDIKFKYQDEYQSLVNYLEEEAKENEKVDIRNISQAFVR